MDNMTQFTLFMELLDTMNDLLEGGFDSDNVYHARMKMDCHFAKFDEINGIEQVMPVNLLDGIAKKLVYMPELKQYAKMIETFQAENEIYLLDLPLKIEEATTCEVQLIIGFFTILNELLEAGMTNCNVYEAHIRLDDLFKVFEDKADGNEELLTAILNTMPSGLEDMPINVNTFFNDLTHHLGIPILLNYSEGNLNAAI
jgi:hypothetical protein